MTGNPERDTADSLAEGPAGLVDGSGRRVWKAGTLVYSGAGLAALFCWLVWGDFAWAMRDRATMPLAQLLLKQFGAGDFVVGTLVGSLPAALAMLLGPVISVYSDRHRGRWGRRIPFLLIPTPIAVLTIVAMAYTPELARGLEIALGVHSPGINACRLLVFSVLWTLFEVFAVTANAIFGALINDVVPHLLIGRFFSLFRAVGLLAGIVFNFWVIGHAEQHYRSIFIGVGLLYGLGFGAMCLGVKEGEYGPVPQRPQRPGGISWTAPLRAYFRDCFTHSYYVLIYAAWLTVNACPAALNSFSVIYARSIGLNMTAYGHLLVITFAISFVIAYPIGWMTDHFHPLRVGGIAIGLYAALSLWAGLCATTAGTFSIALVGHGVLSGAIYTSTASLMQRLFPKQKFAQFASAAIGIASLGLLIVPPMMGAILDATGHAYRETFIAGGALATVGAFLFAVVYRRFLALGGHEAYRPPE